MNMKINKADLFLRLFFAFKYQFPEASVMWWLLVENADEHWIETSGRIINKDLGGAVTMSSIQRAILVLVESGIIARKPYPNCRTKYRINVDVLQTILAAPLPESCYLPGLGTEPIPFLTRQQSQSPSASDISN